MLGICAFAGAAELASKATAIVTISFFIGYSPMSAALYHRVATRQVRVQDATSVGIPHDRRVAVHPCALLRAFRLSDNHHRFSTPAFSSRQSAATGRLAPPAAASQRKGPSTTTTWEDLRSCRMRPRTSPS